MANGIADDLSSNILLASKKIKIIAPAMNSNMWNNTAVKKLKFLSKINVKIFSPKKGRMACGSVGSGKLMEVNDIVEGLNDIFSPKRIIWVKNYS